MDQVPESGWYAHIRRTLRLEDVPPRARRVIVGVIGGTVLVIGIALIVLPGPAFVVIPLGLAILATEFVWAQRWLKKVRSYMPGKKNNGTHPKKDKKAKPD